MFDIRALTQFDQIEQVESLQRLVWPGSETDVVPAHLLAAISHSGGVLLGAFDDDRLVGFVLGFVGVDEESPRRVAMASLKHTSHMLGVHPEYRGQGIGLALKLAQRKLVLDQGIRLMTWTYDPLLSTNAHLNIRRLGAISHRYLKDAYGEMRDQLNEGQASDRFEVEWWVTSPRVVTRIEARRSPLDLASFLAAGVEKINPATLGEDDLPRPAEQIGEIAGNLILVEIPPDFQAMRQRDAGLAAAWRQHSRQLFVDAFEAGYIVTDFIYHGEETVPRSYYVLVYGESTLG